MTWITIPSPAPTVKGVDVLKLAETGAPKGIRVPLKSAERSYSPFLSPLTDQPTVFCCCPAIESILCVSDCLFVARESP